MTREERKTGRERAPPREYFRVGVEEGEEEENGKSHGCLVEEASRAYHYCIHVLFTYGRPVIHYSSSIQSGSKIF